MEGSHVVVVGGGPGGLLSAAHFASLGARVAVYERRTAEEQTCSQPGWTIALGRLARDAIEGADVSASPKPDIWHRCLRTTQDVAGKSRAIPQHSAHQTTEHLELCRIEGAIVQTGLSEPAFVGKWVPKETYKGLSIIMKSFSAFEFFTTRQMITEHLRKEIREKHSEYVTLCDGMMLVGGDLPKGEVILEKATAQTQGGNGSSVNGSSVNESEVNESAEESGRITVNADIVVGADGAGSKTRRLLQELYSSNECHGVQDPEFKATRVMSQVSSLPFDLSLPHTAEKVDKLLSETPSGKPFVTTPAGFEATPDGGSSISIQRPARDSPVSDVRLLTLHFRKGGTEGTGLMTCSTTWWEEQASEEQLLETLTVAFPQIPTAWLQSCAATAFEAKEYALRTSSFVKCSKLGSGRCVLIGDAAHAVSPNISAGATHALHDAALLGPCALELVMLPPSLRPLQSFRSSKSFKDILGSPKKSSTETGFLNGFERFECIAEEWTLLRLKDAHALSNLSEKLNNGMLYPLHKNLGLFMRSLPIYIPWLLTAVSFPIKGVLPSFSPRNALINGGPSPAEVQETFHRSFCKLVAVAGVSCAVAAGVGVHLLRSKRSQ